MIQLLFEGCVFSQVGKYFLITAQSIEKRVRWLMSEGWVTPGYVMLTEEQRERLLAFLAELGKENP